MVKRSLKSPQEEYVFILYLTTFSDLLLQLCFSVCIVIWSIVGLVIGQIRSLKVWIYGVCYSDMHQRFLFLLLPQ